MGFPSLILLCIILTVIVLILIAEASPSRLQEGRNDHASLSFAFFEKQRHNNSKVGGRWCETTAFKRKAVRGKAPS